MSNPIPLNPDAKRKCVDMLLAYSGTPRDHLYEYPHRSDDSDRYISNAESLLDQILAAALPEVISNVEAFINHRPEYIHALKNTRSGDDMSDYSRWNGHAESRRQLAQALGWTVPHNPGETTRPEVKP